LRGEIEKVCAFLGKTLSEEKIQSLLKHLHFDNFSKNRAVNYETTKEEGFSNDKGHFIRKGEYVTYLQLNKLKRFNYLIGKTGDWKNHFSPEMNSRLDEWIKKNLEGTDLKFTMELDRQD